MTENMTVYHNADEEYDWDKYFKSIDVTSAVIYSVVFVLGVLGNGLVIWVTAFKMKKKNVNTVWYLNLAVADFLATAFLPLNITQRALDNRWPFGWFMCKVDTMVFYMNMYASIYILVLLSVDRCVTVVHALWAQNNRTLRKAYFLSLGVWVMAMALSIPHVISKELDFGFCWDYPELPLVITNLVVGFVVPFSIIVFCYSVLIYRLTRGRCHLTSSTRRIVASIIAVFFLCWLPFHIIRLIYVVEKKFSMTLGVVLEVGVPISLTLALLNSCLNPLLYAFMGRDCKNVFRRSILQVLEKAFAEERNNTASDEEY